MMILADVMGIPLGHFFGMGGKRWRLAYCVHLKTVDFPLIMVKKPDCF